MAEKKVRTPQIPQKKCEKGRGETGCGGCREKKKNLPGAVREPPKKGARPPAFGKFGRTEKGKLHDDTAAGTKGQEIQSRPKSRTVQT